MKTTYIGNRMLKALAGTALAVAFASEPTQAVDLTAWDKTFPKSEKVEHRKVDL